MLHSRANDALVMHEDAELAALLDSEILGRETIREWPLSWTQKIELADGRAFAYKSQLSPLIEPEFFAACDSPLLPGHRVLDTFGECSGLLVEWLDAPSLADMGLPSEDLVMHAQEVVRQIASIGGELPVYLDVGTPASWSAEVDRTLEKLRTVISDGRFRNLAADLPDRLQDWAASDDVVERIASSSRVVHRDLKAEHVFLVDGAYKVIDWSVPTIAPGDVDLVWMLKGSGLGSPPSVDTATVEIAYFLGLRWAIVGQHDIFPSFPNFLFEYWASEGAAAILRG